MYLDRGARWDLGWALGKDLREPDRRGDGTQRGEEAMRARWVGGVGGLLGMCRKISLAK